jgi:hypothetical protein
VAKSQGKEVRKGFSYDGGDRTVIGSGGMERTRGGRKR